MAGKTIGHGVYVCNIPTQMSVVVVGKKIIGDDCSAADVSVTVDMDEAVTTIMKKTAEFLEDSGVTSLLGNVMPTECQVFNADPTTWTDEQIANNGWSTQKEGKPFLPVKDAEELTGMSLAEAMDAAQTLLPGKMQGFVDQCTGTANESMKASANALAAIGGAGDIASIQAAVASFPPNTIMGGVQQSAQQLQKFTDIAAKMKSTDSALGGAMAEVKSFTKDAMMLSAMGKLGSAIAMKAGLPAPPSMDDALNCISNGVVSDSLNVLNTGMSCVSAVANLPAYSGQLDDINDIVFQGSGLGLTGIPTPFAAAAGFCSSIPTPAWTPSNKVQPSVRISPPDRLLVSNGQASAKCTTDATGTIISLAIVKAGQGYTSTPTVTIDPPANGTAATATCTVDASGSVNSITLVSAGTGYTAGGAFPEGMSLSDAFPMAEQAIIKGVETAKGLIDKALAPLGDLGAAVCGAAAAGDLSATILPNLNVGLEDLYQKASEQWNEMSPTEQAQAKREAEARRAQAELDH